MLRTQVMFPYNTCVVGTDRYPSALIAKSLSGTCGVVVFQTNLGNEAWIYVNGVQPSQVMFGGKNEVFSNPAGGVAIGGSITHPALPQPVLRNQAGWMIFGSDRVSSSIMIRGSMTTAGTPVWIPPAIGLMNNGGQHTPGTDIHYLFVLDTGALMTLYNGTEADYKNPPGAATTVAAIAPSGGLSGTVLNWDTVRRDGRATLSDDWRGLRSPLIIQSAGKSAAIGLVTGDFLGATALYLNPITKAVTTDDLQSWYSWSGA